MWVMGRSLPFPKRLRDTGDTFLLVALPGDSTTDPGEIRRRLLLAYFLFYLILFFCYSETCKMARLHCARPPWASARNEIHGLFC